jgi:uncharacterized BrkB/YihY/UPF0761 family membrane protein
MSDVDPESADATDASTPTESTKAKRTSKKTPGTKKAAPKKPAPKKTAPKKTAPKKTAPKQATEADDSTVTAELEAVAPDVDAPADATAVAEPVTDDPTPDERGDAPVRPSETPDGTGDEHPSRIDQVKAFAAEVEARGRQTYEHLEEQRAESRAIDSVFVAAEHDERIGGGILAGAVAFRLFLFLVPLVFVVVVGIGLGADAAGKSTHDAAESAGAAGLLARSMANVADGSVGSRLTAFVIGSFALWLTSRSALKVLRVASGLTWGVPVPKLPRPTRAAGIFILIVLAGVVLVQLIGAMREASFGIGLLATVLFVLVPAGLWLVVSLKGFPHAEDAGWRAMVPGSVLVGVGLQLLHLFTVFWISRQVESKSETYGAIGVALALLFWAYLMGRVIIAGMSLNAALWYRDHPRDEAGVAAWQSIRPIKEQ